MQAILPNGQIAAITPTLSKLSEQNDLIQVSASENLVTLKAFNKSIRLSIDVTAEVLEPGSTTVRASKFLACSNAQKLNVLKIESNPASLTISCEAFRAIIPAVDPGVFIPFPELGDDFHTASAPADQLVQAFSIAQPCANNSGFDIWEDSFFLETGDTSGVVVCSDRTQMASVKFPCSGAGFKCCIPQPLFLNCLNLTHEEVMIRICEGLIEFSAPHVRILSSLVATMMPAIRPIMLPLRQQSVHTATFDKESLMIALGLASQLDGERPSFLSYFDLDTNACRMRCNGDRVDEINADLQGKSTRPARLYFDYKRLLSCLRNLSRLRVTSNNITIRYSEPLQPLFIDLEENTDDFYSLMPRRAPTQENQ